MPLPLVCFFALGVQALCNSLTYGQEPPAPRSHLITNLTWHWETRQTAAIGSDLWPVTWGPDDNLYVAWGDGGGFGGSDSDGRVSLGFGRIEGAPEHFHGFNINGGKNPEHPASFPKKGKTVGLISENGILYSLINLQDGKWPNVNHVLAWSTNNGATWEKCDWIFPQGEGNFMPAQFLNFGKDGEGAPDSLKRYVYICGGKQRAHAPENTNLYLTRVPREKIREQNAFEFFSGTNAQGGAEWNRELTAARPIFSDANGAAPGGIVYDLALKRFLLTTFHTGPGQLGVFEAERPWGPWSTIYYDDRWGGMGSDGEGLSCEFPPKWMSADGLTLWAIFSAYGPGAKQGINAHDRFNLVKAVLSKGNVKP
jgi:hypothetical protein